MRFAIGSATVHDLASVAVIERAAFSDPWSLRSFREALDSGSVYFACARSDAGSVLGYVVAWFVADQGEIANIAVAPDQRGRGVGRALLDAALGEAATRGIAAVFLEVRDSNQRARELYASRGFEEVGRRRRYYRRPVEDAIVLRRTLSLAGV
ncbi:MAG TPA: ribosomal protein S18-alanine N-acetyltransferase [Gemmatimonadaceae bacterium]|jgi:[ribosomal protein S18]-alanine N-acetyltransferase|nr:ribosomal protein S18-alanine N-acetyltransferase [Gemmatimonadaceae bacterium]